MNTAVSVASLASATAVAAPSIAAEIPAQSVDPIFAAIERHRNAWRKCQELDCMDLDERERLDDTLLDTLCDRELDLRAELLNKRPTTLRGCVALLRHVGEHAIVDKSTLYDDYREGISGPGGALLGMVAEAINTIVEQHEPLLGTLAAAPASVHHGEPASDPIYKLLKKHDAVWCDYKAACEEQRLADLANSGSKAAEKAFKKAEDKMHRIGDRHAALWTKIIATAPTTDQGLVSKLQHLARISRDTNETEWCTDLSDFRALVKSTLKAVV